VDGNCNKRIDIDFPGKDNKSAIDLLLLGF